jgi:Zn ribbon nucleic-acid-binding protein
MFPTSPDQYVERINAARPKALRLQCLIYGGIVIWLTLLAWSCWMSADGFFLRMMGLAIMLPVVWAIRTKQQLHQNLGISCPHCRRPNNSGMALKSLLESGCCFGCGYKMLEQPNKEEAE